MTGEGAVPAADRDESGTPPAPTTESAPTVAEPDVERERSKCAPDSTTSSSISLEAPPREVDPGIDALLDHPRADFDEHGAIPWIDRRLGEFTRRLETRLLLDPELRLFGEPRSHVYSQRVEREQQALGERFVDEVRSSFTDLVRDEMKPMRRDAAAMFLEEPFLELFSVDSSLRHPADPDATPPDPALPDEASSFPIVKSTHSPLPRLLRSIADQTSRVVPGDVDFGASVTPNRLRASVTFRPWTDVDAPVLLRSFRIRLSRAYEDYRSDTEIVDRFDCSLELFATPKSRGLLLLEREHSDQETVTRLGLSWVSRF
jgi:hypothetical protein